MPLNRCQIEGNLGKDPELKYSQSGKPYCQFSVAVWGRGAKGEEITTWFKCVSFGEIAEAIAKEGFKKGQPIHCEGPVRLETFKDKDGVERSSLAMTVFEGWAVEKKPAGDQQRSQEPPRRQPTRTPPEKKPSDDLDLSSIPF